MTAFVPYAEVIGDPIAQSKSPIIHKFWLTRLGMEGDYRALRIRSEELAAYLSSRREDSCWRGCNITIPHKVETLKNADLSTSTARSVGAANILFPEAMKLVADNSDVTGVFEAISGFNANRGLPCVIGSGGAARAAFQALSDIGVERVAILSRRPERAVASAENFAFMGVGVALGVAADALHDSSLLINASPMGMSGQASLPQEIMSGVSLMAKDAIVFDMVYDPIDTDLLKVARASGLKSVDGLTMLIAQAAGAFELFFGVKAPREYDAELRGILTA